MEDQPLHRTPRPARLWRSAPSTPRNRETSKIGWSHIFVPYDVIAAAGPYDQPAGEELRSAVQPDFSAYLDRRAELVHRFIIKVCDGNQPHLRDLFDGA